MTRIVRNVAGIILGSLITALALDIFLIPNKIAAGGVSGLATVLHYLLDFPVGLIMLAFEIPLLLISVRIVGAKFGVYTLLGAFSLAFFIDIFAARVPIITQDLLLASIFGGVMTGVGIGIVFRFEGSTGGTDQVAAVLNKLTGISMGQALLMTDFLIIAAAGITFSAELALYATIALFVMTQVIDLVQEGPSSAKAFFIMSMEAEKITQDIMQELDRGVTYLEARGGYTNAKRDVVFCVVSKREISRIKEIVWRADKKAFVIVADAHEVLGEGFKRPQDI